MKLIFMTNKKNYAIIVLAIVVAVFIAGCIGQTTPLSNQTATELVIDTNTADAGATSASTSASSFVNESTPDAQQVVPDYK